MHNLSILSTKKTWQKIVHNVSGWSLMAPSLILFCLLVWRPIIIGVVYSFFDLKGFDPVTFVGLENYKDILSDTNFIATLKNTFFYVFWSLVIGFPFPFICAVLVNEMVHAKGFFKVATYLPVVVPAIAASLIWRFVYADGPGGLLNTILMAFDMEPRGWLSNKQLSIPLIIITMTWKGFGSSLIMYLATLQGINNDLYEAARLDGAGLFDRIRHVLIPHMRGLLLLNVVRQIMGVFQEMSTPLVMTGGGPNNASMTLGLTSYYYAFKYGQYEKSLAMGVIMFLMLVGMTFVYFHFDKKAEV